MVLETLLPAVVFVHGAFHTPEHYQLLVDRLQSIGFQVTIPRLPNTSAQADSGNALAEDAACVVDTIRRTVFKGLDVVVICHSYGGMVATEAVSQLCGTESMHITEPGRGQIRGLIYVAAFVPAKGESTMQQYGDRSATVAFDFRAGNMGFHRRPEAFYNTTPEELRKQAIENLVPVPLSAMTGAAPYGWQDYGLPVTYIICDIDRLVPVWMQESAVARCGQLRNATTAINVRHIASDHSPYLSKLDELVEILSDACHQV